MHWKALRLAAIVFLQPSLAVATEIAHPTVRELLTRHEIVVQHASYSFDGERARSVADEVSEQFLHRDSKGAVWLVVKKWRNLEGVPEGKLKERRPDFVIHLCTSHPRYGGVGITLMERDAGGERLARVRLTPSPDVDPSIASDAAGWVNPTMGHALSGFGYLHSDAFDVGRIGEFQPVTVQGPELQSSGRLGDYWIDFANFEKRVIRKARVVKLSTHYRFGATLREASLRMMAESRQELPLPKQMKWELQCDQWTEVDGFTVPARFTRYHEFISEDGETFRTKDVYALAYRPVVGVLYDFEVPDGTLFFGRAEDGGIIYEWRDGKRVPVAHAPTIAAIEDTIKAADVTESRDRTPSGIPAIWVLVGTVASLIVASGLVLIFLRFKASRTPGH